MSDLTDSQKLDAILGMVEQLMSNTEGGAVAAATAVAAPPLMAYDRPSLTVAEIKFSDGKTNNIDGSVWAISDGHFKDQPAGEPYRTDYGYISPTKTPHIWAAGKQYLGDGFAVWEAAWKANPYAIYKVDLEDIIVNNKMPMNFMLFDYMAQSSYTVVQ